MSEQMWLKNKEDWRWKIELLLALNGIKETGIVGFGE